MGYGTVLLQLPDHMAVGVLCPDSAAGSSYEFEGSRYCYLETTGPGWTLGEVPPDFRAGAGTAVVHPLVRVPRIDLQFTAELERTDLRFAYYRVRCEIENLGPGTGSPPEGARRRSRPLAGRGDDMVSRQHARSRGLPRGRPGAETTLKIPRGETTRIRCAWSTATTSSPPGPSRSPSPEPLRRSRPEGLSRIRCRRVQGSAFLKIRSEPLEDEERFLRKVGVW